jgi:hypothetical protein
MYVGHQVKEMASCLKRSRMKRCLIYDGGHIAGGERKSPLVVFVGRISFLRWDNKKWDLIDGGIG